MDLADQLNHLMLLQTTEDDILQVEKDSAALEKDIRAQEKKLKELDKELEKVHQERISNQKNADSLEVKIQAKKEENEKMQVQLNTTKNQQDYDRILKKIMSNKADASKWEDEELQALDEADNLKDREARLKSEIAEEKNKLEDIKARVKKQQERYDAELEKLQSKRQALRNQVGRDLLMKFDRLSNSRNKNALAKVKDRVCRGCFTQIPKQLENELMRADKPVFLP